MIVGLEILIFAVVAIFLALRLRDILGRSEGKRKLDHPFDVFKETQDETGASDETEAKQAGKGFSAQQADGIREEVVAKEVFHEKPEINQAICDIRSFVPDFHPKGFLEGAETAYEVIIQAFASGDLGKLKGLMIEKIHKDLSRVIEERKSVGEALETTLIGFPSVEIVNASLQGKTAKLSVLFTTEQVDIVRNAEGDIIENANALVSRRKNRWTFMRELDSRDPNWVLISIESLD